MGFPTKPASLPTWATDTNFPAGVNSWSGTPTKVEPTSGKKAGGFVPKTKLPAQEMNWKLSDMGLWVNYFNDDELRKKSLKRLYMEEDFIGGSSLPARWTLTGTGTWFGSANGVVVLGSSGALFAPIGVIGTNDFHAACYITNANTGVPDPTFQIYDQAVGVGANPSIRVLASRLYSNWAVSLNGASSVDTGVAYGASAYVDLYRLSNVLTLYINGTLIYTVAYTSSIGTSNGAIIQASVGSSGTMIVDKFIFDGERA